jgi:hypothetical protein
MVLSNLICESVFDGKLGCGHREFVDDGLSAEAAVPAGLCAAEWHLSLVGDGRPIDVADSEGPVSDQVSNALAAAATTFSTSASVAAGARVATLPVMGSLRSKVPPPSAATAPPSTINPISIDTLLIFKTSISQTLRPPAALISPAKNCQLFSPTSPASHRARKEGQ